MTTDNAVTDQRQTKHYTPVDEGENVVVATIRRDDRTQLRVTLLRYKGTGCCVHTVIAIRLFACEANGTWRAIISRHGGVTIRPNEVRAVTAAFERAESIARERGWIR